MVEVLLTEFLAESGGGNAGDGVMTTSGDTRNKCKGYANGGGGVSGVFAHPGGAATGGAGY